MRYTAFLALVPSRRCASVRHVESPSLMGSSNGPEFAWKAASSEKVIHPDGQVKQHSVLMGGEVQSRHALDFFKAVGDCLLMKAEPFRGSLLRAIRRKIDAKSFEQRLALRRLLGVEATQFLGDEVPKSAPSCMLISNPATPTSSTDRTRFRPAWRVTARATRASLQADGIASGDSMRRLTPIRAIAPGTARSKSLQSASAKSCG